MRKAAISFIFLAVVFICGCKPDNHLDKCGKYYVHSVLFPWQNGVELMLKTQSAVLVISPKGETADISFDFKGAENGYQYANGISSIDEFQIRITGIPIDRQGRIVTFNGEGIAGDINYTMRGRGGMNKSDSISRDFTVTGSLDEDNTVESRITLSSKILNSMTMTLTQMVSKETNAELPQLGGWVITDRLRASRVFVNESGHRVAVRADSDIEEYVIQANSKKEIVLFDSPDCYTFTFDDGKVSRHERVDNDYEYAGIPLQLEENPFLSIESAIMMYDVTYRCTYTITPEIYAGAVSSEK